jgi:hypothetical protein
MTGWAACGAAEWQWHASGLPAAIHTRPHRQGEPCGLNNGDIDLDIVVDERGNWVRQSIELTPTDCGRRRIGLQTRDIEYR